MDAPVFDADDFLHRLDSDVDLLNEVLEIFLEDTPELIAALISGMKDKNVPAVERAVHTLKGAAANISAKRLHSVCQRIQTLVRQDAEADLVPLIKVLEKNFHDLDQTLRGVLKN